MHPHTTDRPALARPPAGDYCFDMARTDVRFQTSHAFGLGTVNGRFHPRSVELKVTDGNDLRLNVVLDAAGFESGNRSRDKAIRSARYLDVARHPHIVFEAGELWERDGPWLLVGALTAHGVTSRLEVVVQQLQQNTVGEWVMHATTTIDRHVHGVSADRAFVARRLAVEIGATATRRTRGL